MDETVKKLLEMKIHECIEMKDQGITIVRVPGGWVYSLYLRSIFQSVFVPFSTDMCRRIIRDIAGLNGRIRDAEENLTKLKRNPPKTKKILSRKQKTIQDEIKHVQKLISIAAEALE